MGNVRVFPVLSRLLLDFDEFDHKATRGFGLIDDHVHRERVTVGRAAPAQAQARADARP